jgi:hypothetical protein
MAEEKRIISKHTDLGGMFCAVQTYHAVFKPYKYCMMAKRTG